MKTKTHNEIIIGVLIIFIAILLNNCKEKSKVSFSSSDVESQKYKFSEFIKNIHKFPYEASPKKRKRVIDGFMKLTLGMNKEEVKKILGEPDDEFFSYDTTRVKTYIGSSWGYNLRRYEAEYGNKEYDQGIGVYFDPSEKVYWAHSYNIASLKDKGSPYMYGEKDNKSLREGRENRATQPSR